MSFDISNGLFSRLPRGSSLRNGTLKNISKQYELGYSL